MSYSEQARATARRERSTAAVVLTLALAAIIGAVLGYRSVAAPTPSATSPVVTVQDDAQGRAGHAPDPPLPPVGADRALPGGVTVDDGVVPDGVTVFDGGFPAEYGSEEEAARWVATAETSLHVSGDAVDVGHSDATAWLSEHGAEYGLCQVYGNEPWHYELRPGAADHGCPIPYADPTHDPRMQQ
jgi:D-alanyl-D-alanine carboxypeptidase